MEKAQSIEDIEGYDKFVEDSKANFFYQKFWMKLLEKTNEEVLYFYTRDRGEVRSFLGLSKEKSSNICYALPFWVCEEVFIEKDLDEFIKEFEKLNTNALVLGNISKQQAKNLEKKGFIVYPSYVYPQLRIKSMKDFWNSLERNQKKNLKRATRFSNEENIEICNVSTQEDLKQYFLLEKETMKRNNDTPESLNYWREILSNVPREKIMFLLAKKEGKAIAGRISLVDKDKIFNIRGVSLKGFQKYRANELLHLYVIEQAIEKGINCIDYGASSISRSGSYIFKKKFANDERILWEAVYPLKEKTKKEYLKKAKENTNKLNSFLLNDTNKNLK